MAANSFDGEEKMSIDEKVPADGGLYDSLHKSDEALIDEKVPARGSLHDSFLKTEMPIEHKRENVRGRMAYILGGHTGGHCRYWRTEVIACRQYVPSGLVGIHIANYCDDCVYDWILLRTRKRAPISCSRWRGDSNPLDVWRA